MVNVRRCNKCAEYLQWNNACVLRPAIMGKRHRLSAVRIPARVNADSTSLAWRRLVVGEHSTVQ